MDSLCLTSFNPHISTDIVGKHRFRWDNLSGITRPKFTLIYRKRMFFPLLVGQMESCVWWGNIVQTTSHVKSSFRIFILHTSDWFHKAGKEENRANAHKEPSSFTRETWINQVPLRPENCSLVFNETTNGANSYDFTSSNPVDACINVIMALRKDTHTLIPGICLCLPYMTTNKQKQKLRQCA